MVAGQPRLRVRFALTWPHTSASHEVQIRLTSSRAQGLSGLRGTGYRLEAKTNSAPFTWSTDTMRALGTGASNDITVRAVATTTETIGGRSERVYLPLDLARERRMALGRYVLYFALASEPIQKIAFSAIQVEPDGRSTRPPLDLPLMGPALDRGRVGSQFVLIDMAKQSEGIYRVRMSAVASSDGRPVAAEFLMRHGSTESGGR